MVLLKEEENLRMVQPQEQKSEGGMSPCSKYLLILESESVARQTFFFT